ncbi:hypothetical protein [Gossypium barbadense]|uniref:FCP1 homology domain-containing protein n=1 Tax=Gossypium barbadense TaxID=3634 RepID=A0A5J5NFA8_GOSBA|nr:hypothetical protein [Gossypium barbadense]
MEALLNWLAFFFQIFAQIIRAVGQYLFSSSTTETETKTTTSSSTHRFKPLPVVDSVEIECPSTVEIAAVLDSPVPIDEDRTEKLTVVLDLDETLVCAYETSSLPPALRSQATDAGLKWFELECVSSDKEFEGKSKISYVTVFERPGLQEFLNQLSEFAELVLFTAGLEGYARPLVDRIDAENRFSHRLYRPSTICTEFREHVKDLSCLSKNLCRTVIVDNNPFSFLLQPLNGIPCIPFSAGGNHMIHSFWMSSFHFSSTFLYRKTCDLFFMIGSTCPNGFKSKGSLLLVGLRKKEIHYMYFPLPISVQRYHKFYR